MSELAEGQSIWGRAAGALDLLSGMIEAQALAASAKLKDNDRVAIIIISGFLGAGKSTLLRHVLTGAQGMRIAAVVNDFAALNIDAALIGETSDDTIALENGCICCSLSGGIARSLLAICARSERPDLIIVEASGVADPANIAQIIGTLPGLVLDSIVVVVDASADHVSPEIAALEHQQILSADMILLNKVDLVCDSKAEERALALRAASPHATVIRTSKAAVPLPLLLDYMHELQDLQSAAQPADKTVLFQSVALPIQHALDRPLFERELSTLPKGVLRLKGFVRFLEAPDVLYLVQWVGNRWRIEPCNVTPGALGLVVIGHKQADFRAIIERHFSQHERSPNWSERSAL